MKNLLIGIFISAAAVTVVLASGELAVRALYPVIANYDTEMWRYASLGKVLTSGEEVSHRNRPGVHFEDLYGVRVDINSKGLRDHEYGYRKMPGVYRILVLGDSVTFGWGVQFEDTYPKRLERALNARRDGIKYEVLNSGSGNYKTRDEAIFLKEEGLKYDPDMLILGYFVNDAEPHSQLRQYGLKRSSYLYAYLWSKWNAILTKFLPGKRFDNYYHALYEEGSKTFRDVKKYSEEIVSCARERDLPLLIAMIPDVRELDPYPFSLEYGQVKRIFESRKNIEVMDLTSYFDVKAGPEAYWVSLEDAHPNALAHGIIADALYPEVVRLIESGKTHKEAVSERQAGKSPGGISQ
jgi:lysophospholipase L1-like esterase